MSIDAHRIVLDAIADAYAVPAPAREIYDFHEGDPSIYDLRECDFRAEDVELLEAAADRADGERRRLMLLLVEAMRREGCEG